MRWGLAVCLVLFLASTAFSHAWNATSYVDSGQIFYIANDGDDSWSGLLPDPDPPGLPTDGPWETFDNIWTRSQAGNIVAGDQFLLNKGDTWELGADPWGLRFSNAFGHPANPIVIGSYGTGARPIISGVDGSSEDQELLRFSDSAFVTIEGIHLIGGTNTGHFVYGDADGGGLGVFKIKFKDMHLDNTSQDQTEGGNGLRVVDVTSPYAKLRDYEVSDSIFDSIGGPVGGTTRKIDCISIIAAEGGLYFHDNTFYDCADQCIDINSGVNNRVINNLCLGAGHDGSYPGMKFHSQESHSSDSVVAGNVVAQSAGVPMAFWNVSEYQIFNNTLHSEGTYALYFGDNGVAIGEFDNNELSNNALLGAVYIDGYGFAIADDNTFQNNFYSPADTNVIYFDDLTDWVTSAEFASDWVADGDGVTGDENTDPEVVDATFTDSDDPGDYHLQAGANAIDAGVTVNRTVDIDGVSVPQDGGIDVGAYEYTP